MAKKEHMSTKEAAAYIGYSVATLVNWRHNKDYGPKYVLTKSGRIWYSQEDLDDWMSSAWSRASNKKQKLADITS